MTDRYHRQTLLPQIGDAGQAAIRTAHVVLLGVGALGSSIAEQLVRAGIGTLTLVDRDVVELTNLQRQTLFDESDAERGLPKVEAAATRLRAINSEVKLFPRALDIDSANIESLVDPQTTLILDGSDNAELRYLINDVSVKRNIPWVMGACIGTEGRVAGFDPRRAGSPCLRCLFATPPSAGELATCDTAGVLAPAIGVVASLQVAMAMQLIVSGAGAREPSPLQLHTLDVWAGRFKSIDLTDAQRDDCVCCGKRHFEFLSRISGGGTKLCGRKVVQVRPPTPTRIDLIKLADRVRALADVDVTQLMLKLVLHEKPDNPISIFGDGRMLVFGTDDSAVARGIYARVIGV